MLDMRMYVNSGLFICNRSDHRVVFETAIDYLVDPETPEPTHRDQTLLNLALQSTGTEILFLDRAYNWLDWGSPMQIKVQCDPYRWVTVQGGKPDHAVVGHAICGHKVPGGKADRLDPANPPLDENLYLETVGISADLFGGRAPLPPHPMTIDLGLDLDPVTQGHE